MVTVLIPTFARPAMLRVALRSVAEQTALARITRVFVSENGGDRTSQAVCQEFPQLPITYLFRDPPVGPLGHARVLMKECLDGDFTCILHDDDWWLPHHLQDALAALEADPEASVYGANTVICQNDVLLENEDNSFAAWFAADYPQGSPLWRISHSNIFIGLLLGLVVHYSSMVARTSALCQSAHVYDLDNPFDTDRMITFALSRCGPVLFNPKFGVAVRVHESRDTANYDWQEKKRRMTQTTEWMVGSGMKPWAAVASIFVKRLGRCPREDLKKDLICAATGRVWCLPEIARHLDRTKDKEFFMLYDYARQAFAGKSPRCER